MDVSFPSDEELNLQSGKVWYGNDNIATKSLLYLKLLVALRLLLLQEGARKTR